MFSRLIILVLSTILTIGSLAQDKLCEEVDLKCIGSKETRKIEGVNVTKPCWKYTYRLDCKKKALNNCDTIDPNLCTLLREECAGYVEGIEGGDKICSHWKREYSCQKVTEYEVERTELRKEGDEISRQVLECSDFCIDGNCDAVEKAALESNKELPQTIGYLHALKEIKEKRLKDYKEKYPKGATIEELREELYITHNIKNIFSGEQKSCTNYIAHFMNCCRENPIGWGEMICLGRCSQDEQSISQLRNKKQCIAIGSECTSWLEPINPFSTCVEETSAFCCYDSILARIMIQEAKKQLGRNFGTVKTPDCGGISLEDIDPQDKNKQGVDFSKADYKDFYDSVVVPDQKVLEEKDYKADINRAKTTSEAIKEASKDAVHTRKGYSTRLGDN